MARDVLAIIPARAGSKGIPGKNVKPIAGRPLIAWALEAALSAERVTEVVLATDDDRAAEIAARLGATVFRRSAAGAGDLAPTEAVLQEVIDANPARAYLLVQATSPLVTAADLDRAVALLDEGYDSVASVVEQTRFTWREAAAGAEAVNYDYLARPRRQDATAMLVENGAVYAFTAESFAATGNRLGGRIGLVRMSPESYYEIDEPADWIVVDALLRRSAQAPTDARLAEIALVISDVDGVLTDGGMYWTSDGSESKRFSARDGKGFERLRLAGVSTALVTAENIELVRRRGAKLGCVEVVLGSTDKRADVDAIRRRLGLEWSQIAFLGDDVQDCEVMVAAGVSAAPQDGFSAARDCADIVLDSPGGHGAFREFAELVLAAKARQA